MSSSNILDLIPRGVHEKPEKRILDEEHGVVEAIAGARISVCDFGRHHEIVYDNSRLTQKTFANAATQR